MRQWKCPGHASPARASATIGSRSCPEGLTGSLYWLATTCFLRSGQAKNNQHATKQQISAKHREHLPFEAALELTTGGLTEHRHMSSQRIFDFRVFLFFLLLVPCPPLLDSLIDHQAGLAQR
jgi:hypothetical protein